MNARFIARVRLLTVSAFWSRFIIIGRLYLLQIIRGNEYAARADAQFASPQSPLTDRDSIYFTDKNGNQITAATLKDGFTLAVNPTKVVDAEAALCSAQRHGAARHDDFIAKGDQDRALQYQVHSRCILIRAMGAKLQAENLARRRACADDRWRYYPGGSLAAQELGFVAYNGNTQEGRYGLEALLSATRSTRTDDDLYTNFSCSSSAAAQAVLGGTAADRRYHHDDRAFGAGGARARLVAYDNEWHPAACRRHHHGSANRRDICDGGIADV